MPLAIVTGPFMAPQGTLLVDEHGEAQPAPKILRPSPDGSPVRVELESWAFQRHHKLGNVEAVKSFEIMEQARKASAAAERDARAAADLAREEALKGVEEAGLREDLDRLADLDKQGLVDLALGRRMRISQRQSESKLRADIAARLQAKLDELG